MKKKKPQQNQTIGDRPIDYTVVPEDIKSAVSRRRLAYIRSIFILEMLQKDKFN